jgi:hypothetical protein
MPRYGQNCHQTLLEFEASNISLQFNNRYRNGKHSVIKWFDVAPTIILVHLFLIKQQHMTVCRLVAVMESPLENHIPKAK